MWIIFRLIVLCIGFLVRYFQLFRRRFAFDKMTENGLKFGIIKSTHKGQLVKYYLAVDLQSDTVFEITKEKKSHKILKSLGLYSEIQTGDLAFDHNYYIGSDHYYFNSALKSDRVMRQLIHEVFIFAEAIENIICDGHSLYISSRLEIPHEGLVDKLKLVSDKIMQINQKSKLSLYKDSHVVKLLIVESFLFALIFYAFECFFEYLFVDKYALESPYFVWIPGIITGLIIAAFLMILFLKFFKSSARSHFIVNGNLIIFFLGLPFWGTKTFNDLNRFLDKSSISVEKIIINRRDVVVHRTRKGGKSYTYYWYYRPAEAKSSENEKSITVPYNIYISADGGQQVEIKSRKGAFNYPYRLSINGIEL